MEDEVVIIECPQCGAEQEDFDGFGVVHCEECGYCQHISLTMGVCDICNRVVAQPPPSPIPPPRFIQSPYGPVFHRLFISGENPKGEW